MPDLSLIVCTHNKATALQTTLSALLSERHLEWELLIVDNGSSDRTAEVCLIFEPAFRGAGISFRVVAEPEIGLSAARNAGLRASNGKIAVFLDDDCRVRPGYLREYAAAWSRFPEALAAGGTIVPRWPEGSRPGWLPLKYEWIYGAMSYEGSETRELRWRETINGGNMAINRKLALALGGFSPSLGNQGAQQGGAEEQDMLRRILASGKGMALYVPRAIVDHLFPPERLNIEYAQKRLFDASAHRARGDLRSGSKFEVLARAVTYSIRIPVSPKSSLERAQLEGYLSVVISGKK